MVVAMTVLSGGGVTLAGNLAVQGGANTTSKTQVQQPQKPLVSDPVTNSNQKVQPKQLQTQQIEPVDMRKRWAKYCELAWNATKAAVNTMWIPQARIQNVRINGAIATCGTRCLQGPDIGPLIKGFLLSDRVPVEVANVFADSISGAWMEWQDSVSVPGLHWYPSFVAVPSPHAPLTPSIPTRLIELRARKQAELTSPTRLIERITEQFRLANMSLPPDARNEIKHFSQIHALHFNSWLNGALVKVLGEGPVPSFVPIYVPTGPVVEGNVIPRSGVITGNLR